MSTQEKPIASLYNLFKYFIYLSSSCFGGPIALVSHIQNDLVEKKNWFTREEFQNGLAFSKLLPGPLALQLGLYLAYLRYRVLGATLTFCAFVIPPCLIVLVISYFYVKYHGLTWIQAFLYGVSPCVISIVFKSAINLSFNSIGKDMTLWVIFLIVFILNAFTSLNITMLIICISLFYVFYKNRFSQTLIFFPAFESIIFTSSPTLINIFIFFSSAAILVFGSGFAIIPFIYDGVVKQYGWINEQQFLDAVAVGMITPGPVLVMVTFIGYLLHGLEGAIISTLAIFLPVYLFVIFFSPLYNKLSENRNAQYFINAITACICGAIFYSCFILASKSIVDIGTFIIFIISLLTITKLKIIPEPIMILLSGLVGILLKNH